MHVKVSTLLRIKIKIKPVAKYKKKYLPVKYKKKHTSYGKIHIDYTWSFFVYIMVKWRVKIAR